MCCRVNRCCFCLSLPVGVKVLCMCLMAAELAVIVLGVFFLPRFLFAIAPTSAIGIVCHALLLVAVSIGSASGRGRVLWYVWSRVVGA